jgi:hypothetical protein
VAQQAAAALETVEPAEQAPVEESIQTEEPAPEDLAVSKSVDEALDSVVVVEMFKQFKDLYSVK